MWPSSPSGCSCFPAGPFRAAQATAPPNRAWTRQVQKNPWTGEEVRVVHVSNDPFNYTISEWLILAPEDFPKDGTPPKPRKFPLLFPWRRIGDKLTLNTDMWGRWLWISWLVGLPVMYILMQGGVLGLTTVPTSKWGGLPLTLILSVFGIVASFPLAVALALGRQSELPVIRMICVGFIELIRGVPLITLLFMASLMINLFLPEGMTFDKLLRAQIAIIIFSAAYLAEVIRGGLQALPKGQGEAADALGLSYWYKMGFIILPQALKLVIPGIVNTFIGLFKDTTLVLIIGLLDFLGMIQSSYTDASWATPVQSLTGYLFAAFVYWVFCFSMSRYSIFTERRLHTGH